MKTLHIVVSGRVQGVSYRAHTESKAKQFGITGWVRNLSSGDVELKITGSEEDLKEMVQWLRGGPSLARVDHLEIIEIPIESWEKFKIVY